MSRIFGIYGEICATHPWEVIVAVSTFTTLLLTVDQSPITLKESPTKQCTGCFEEQFNAADVIVMTIIRCLAILYTYHKFRSLQQLGSKYILGIAGMFTVFSSFVFTSTLINFLYIDLAELKDAMFFFLLLIDLSKAATLAEFALTASNREEISRKIARGMSILGPSITLDTVVETLVIGVGTLSGVHRLELLSYFACLSVVVNYVIFMTFYPACLSLMLELSKVTNFYGEKQAAVCARLIKEKEKSNPAVQRVKVIMSCGLLLVHLYSRLSFHDDIEIDRNDENCSENSSFYNYVMKQFVISIDHIVILILLITLMIKFIFFESREYGNPAVGFVEDNAKVEDYFSDVKEGKYVQTDNLLFLDYLDQSSLEPTSERTLEECLQVYRRDLSAKNLTENEVILLVETKHIPTYNLEKEVGDLERGVKIRRKIIQNATKALQTFIALPYKNFDYSKVLGACCENVIGYVPIPLGVAGPLLLDDNTYYIPLATTEGCLVASINRGCTALGKSGVKTNLVADGMTRGPVLRFSSISESSQASLWLEKPENFDHIKQHFDSTSRFARLTKISTRIAGRYLFIRFVAVTGDAMGMNMISKGTEKALKCLRMVFPTLEILSLSGNFCTDKKPSSVNWIEGRGKSVVSEAIISAEVVATVLKTTTHALVDLNISKNMIGSAIAGSIGGFNAHAANIVTAIFLATGQDPAQNVTSSNCLTIMEPWGEKGEDLYISCSMPSIEIGTIGGGTVLPAQSACLEMLGVKGAHEECPGENAKQLARIVCGAVLAGEVSLMAALASGHLVRSHLRYNRSYTEKDSFDRNNLLCGTSASKT